MATVAAFALRAGLRSLTPGPAANARPEPVSGLYEFDPGAPAEMPAGSMIYVPSKRWPEISAPESLPEAMRSAGGIAILVDHDDHHLPPEFVAECVRRSLPVFLLPKAATFEHIHTLLAGDPGSAPEEPAPAGEVAAVRAALDRFLGGTTLSGWLVLRGCVIPGRHPTDPELLRILLSRPPVYPAKAAGTAAALHLTLPESGHAFLLANPDRIALDSRRVAGLLRRLDTHAQAIEVTRSARRDLEGALIRELVDATVASSALDPWARSLGLEPGSRVRAIAATAAGVSAERIPAALQDLACGLGSTCVAGASGESAYALVTLDAAAGGAGELVPFEEALRVLTTLFEFRYGASLSVGTSSFVLRDSNDLVRGLINARQLADRDARATRAVAGRHTLPPPLAATLLTAQPHLSATLDRVLLQPVVDYDRDRGSRYLETLRTFLALDGQFAATATELGIHINTLRYRLTRIERLTGRGVHSTADRVDFYLALCLRELRND
ncbi:helix-turn-helix domain-containing protein [Nocardia sp. NPDC024068]|uniref:PucR family transcriptional regulator n=1 Tax=Nocardia sp. NPDC024068 TaxID=3157197 RepID=UPI0033C40C94